MKFEERDREQFRAGKRGQAVIEAVHDIRSGKGTTRINCSLVVTSEEGQEFRIEKHVAFVDLHNAGMLKEGNVLPVKIHPRMPIRVQFVFRPY